jgi:Cap4 SAVED domain
VPVPFLSVLVQDLNLAPSITGLCAGYELGAWRTRGLAQTVIKSIPGFALSYDELEQYDFDTGLELLARALRVIYATDKYQRRGEFGEILLYMILRQVFDTEPAISKIFFKDSANDTVKGFDAVHVVASPQGELELWLGEVKFYSKVTDAIRDVIEELQVHLNTDYLRAEFAAVTNKLSPLWPHSSKLRDLLSEQTTLDSVFASMAVPVLLTYESRAVDDRVAELAGGADAKLTEAAYSAAFNQEIRAALSKFNTSKLPRLPVKIHLILLPLHKKAKLVDELNRRLSALREGTLP